MRLLTILSFSFFIATSHAQTNITIGNSHSSIDRSSLFAHPVNCISGACLSVNAFLFPFIMNTQNELLLHGHYQWINDKRLQFELASVSTAENLIYSFQQYKNSPIFSFVFNDVDYMKIEGNTVTIQFSIRSNHFLQYLSFIQLLNKRLPKGITGFNQFDYIRNALKHSNTEFTNNFIYINTPQHIKIVFNSPKKAINFVIMKSSEQLTNDFLDKKIDVMSSIGPIYQNEIIEAGYSLKRGAVASNTVMQAYLLIDAEKNHELLRLVNRFFHDYTSSHYISNNVNLTLPINGKLPIGIDEEDLNIPIKIAFMSSTIKTGNINAFIKGLKTSFEKTGFKQVDIHEASFENLNKDNYNVFVYNLLNPFNGPDFHILQLAACQKDVSLSGIFNYASFCNEEVEAYLRLASNGNDKQNIEQALHNIQRKLPFVYLTKQSHRYFTQEHINASKVYLSKFGLDYKSVVEK